MAGRREYDPKRRPNIFYKGDPASHQELTRRVAETPSERTPLAEANAAAMRSTRTAFNTVTPSSPASKAKELPVSGDDLARYARRDDAIPNVRGWSR